jgi:hypothetical protein
MCLLVYRQHLFTSPDCYGRAINGLLELAFFRCEAVMKGDTGYVMSPD